MRLGLVLEPAGGGPPLASLQAQAAALEDVGLELAWLDDRGEPPFVVAAALAVSTFGVRFVCAVATGRHPLAVAASAVVADNCANGRVVVVVRDEEGDEALLGETVELLQDGLASRPFRHRGARWSAPANLPENDGQEERIVITPHAAQPEVPLWLAGPAAPAVSMTHALARVAGEDVDAASAAWDGIADALGPIARRLSRPGLWPLEADASGDFDDDALVATLRAHQRAWGLDAAVFALPRGLSDPARARVAHRLATAVRPRVTMDALPPGVEEHWRDVLPGLAAAAALTTG